MRVPHAAHSRPAAPNENEDPHARLAEIPRADPQYASGFRMSSVTRHHRLIRAVLAWGVTLAIWVLARSAVAAPAPFCDDRGASALAPAPPLEEPQLVLAKAPSTSTCSSGDLLRGSTVARGHRTLTSPVAGGEPFLPSAFVVLPLRQGEVVPATEDSTRPLVGTRSRVERPPRG
jgi:hypothetical protein